MNHVLVHSKLAGSHQCAQVTKKDPGLCQIVAVGKEKWLSASAQHSPDCMEILCAVYALPKQGVLDKLDCVEQRATKMEMGCSTWPMRRRNWSSLSQKTPSSSPAPSILEEMKASHSTTQVEAAQEKKGTGWSRKPSHCVSGKSIFTMNTAER